jgi:hypothetical protein
VLRSITLGFALSALAAACALVETQPLRGSVQVGLAQWGQEFTPGRAPDTGVVPRAAVLGHIEGFPEDALNPVATEPVFGTIRCVIVAKCPGPPGETPALGPIQVWLVEFPNVPRGNGGHAWAVVDAATGNMYFDSDTRPP